MSASPESGQIADPLGRSASCIPIAHRKAIRSHISRTRQSLFSQRRESSIRLPLQTSSPLRPRGKRRKRRNALRDRRLNDLRRRALSDPFTPPRPIPPHPPPPSDSLPPAY